MRHNETIEIVQARRDLKRALIWEGYSKDQAERVFSRSRKAEAVAVRTAYFKSLRASGYSSSYIGAIFNRDHSTVVVGWNKGDK